MFKKMLLAGAVICAGSLWASPKVDAHYGPGVRYGSPIVGRTIVRSYRPYIASPYMAPRYGSGYRYGYQPSFRGPVYGAPVYRSYRGPAGFGPGFGGPVYGPGFYGPGYGRSGFSLNIGPVWRGW